MGLYSKNQGILICVLWKYIVPTLVQKEKSLCRHTEIQGSDHFFCSILQYSRIHYLEVAENHFIRKPYEGALCNLEMLHYAIINYAKINCLLVCSLVLVSSLQKECHRAGKCPVKGNKDDAGVRNDMKIKGSKYVYFGKVMPEEGTR